MTRGVQGAGGCRSVIKGRTFLSFVDHMCAVGMSRCKLGGVDKWTGRSEEEGK